MARKIIIIFALCVFQCHAAVQTVCTLDTSNLGDKEPLFLSEKSRDQHKFKIPVNGVLNFQQNEKLILACATDPKNQGTMNSFYCDKGTFKNSHDSTVANLQPFLQCRQPNIPYARREVIPCLSGNDFYQIGFLLKDGDDFVELYQACLNTVDYTVAYVAHTLHGSSIGRNQGKGMSRPSKFSTQSINKRVSDFYLVDSQKESLGALMSIDYPRPLYFAKGHLSPFADGIFKSHKKATNFMVNVVPQWQEINNGNYGAVEDKVKDLAQELGRDLYVISGGHGSLETNGKALRLGKEPNSPRIPKLLYKIVADKQSKSGIVFVVLNFNADTATNAEPPFCTDICVDSTTSKKRPATPKWNFPRKNEAAKGRLICCTVADFSRKVTWAVGNRIGLDEADQNNVLLPTS